MKRSVVETGFLSPSPPRRVARVCTTAPFGWIRRGIGDFFRVPVISLAYGIIFSVMCYGGGKLIQSALMSNLGYLAGLVFLALFLAAGLLAAGRDIESGRHPSIESSARILWERKSYLALFSLMMAGLFIGWVRISILLFVVVFDTPNISTEAVLSLVFSPDNLIAFGIFATVTLLIATVIFIVSAVALPLVLDGDADFINAMILSLQSAVRNPLAFLVWTGTVALLATVGIAAWLVGSALVFPVLSYASWHSYRDLIE